MENSVDKNRFNSNLLHLISAKRADNSAFLSSVEYEEYVTKVNSLNQKLKKIQMSVDF